MSQIKSLKVYVKNIYASKKLLSICDSQIEPVQLQVEETAGHQAPDVSFLSPTEGAGTTRVSPQEETDRGVTQSHVPGDIVQMNVLVVCT